MRAIRGVNPGARLVQTEDLGTTYSTDHMAYQRNFDDQRRWLTWDLLCGKIDREHGLAEFFLRSSCRWPDLDWFVRNPCAPDVIGINHYVTSDRFLDERTGRYPGESTGSNSIDAYVDVPAVRVLPGAYRGWRVLQEAWQRYRTSLALTEVHLGCTRDEQLRWFHDAWSAASEARRLACDVVAVTSWAMFGSFNWDQLLTRDSGSYEPGAFDCRSSAPRPTAVAHLLRRLSGRLDAAHPSMRSRGWWQRASKLTYPLGQWPEEEREAITAEAAPMILMIGVDENPLSRAMASACARRHLSVRIAPQGLPRELEAIRAQPCLQHSSVWAIIDTRFELTPTAGDADASGAAEGRDLVLPMSVARLADLSLEGDTKSLVIELDIDTARRLSATDWEQLSDASLDLLIDQACGRYRYDLDDHVLLPTSRSEVVPQPAARPRSNDFVAAHAR